MAELGAFCVDPQFRGTGRGDSLLDWVEQDARKRGIDRLVLLTTRTADWFVQREFRWGAGAVGRACRWLLACMAGAPLLGIRVPQQRW